LYSVFVFAACVLRKKCLQPALEKTAINEAH
jgi:hypothetical protein